MNVLLDQSEEGTLQFAEMLRAKESRIPCIALPPIPFAAPCIYSDLFAAENNFPLIPHHHRRRRHHLIIPFL
jgi:hypothetical protein